MVLHTAIAVITFVVRLPVLYIEIHGAVTCTWTIPYSDDWSIWRFFEAQGECFNRLKFLMFSLRTTFDVISAAPRNTVRRPEI